MNEQDRAFMQGQLSLLTRNERQKLLKRAAQMRKTAPKPTTRHFELDDFEDEGPVVGKVRTKTSTLDEMVLKLLREEAAPTISDEGEAKDIATVLTIHKGRCEVDHHGELVLCELLPELAQKQQTELAVGDLVTLSARKEHTFIERVLPRRTKLSRPDPGSITRERVIVANIDVVVVVVSVGTPPLHPRLIDRYLVAIQRGGARPVIAVNKIDLISDPKELEVLQPYKDNGIPVFACSAEEKIGLAELARELEGGVAAFVGHSGVGKSSLLQSLRPDLDILVGGVSEGNSRGAHTTRRSTLYQLGNETSIIDTPGIRSFGLWSLTAEEVEVGFPEFEGLTCRFRDCSHVHEPGCGVRAAVDSGEVSEYRYETFLRLRQSL